MKLHLATLLPLAATALLVSGAPANAVVMVIGNQLAHDCYLIAKAGIDLPTDGELYRFDISHPDTNGMIDYFVKAAMTIDYWVTAGGRRLNDRSVGCMGYIDHHAKIIHFFDNALPVIVYASPGIEIVTGIDKCVGGIVRGQLHGTKTEFVQRTEYI